MNSFRRWLPFIIIFLVIWGIIFVGTSGLLASKSDFDFTPGWVGCRTLYTGETPYTLDITHTIQMEMFDRLLEPDEDQQAFAYPANICLSPLIPFWLMPLRMGVYAWSSLQFLLFLLMLMVFLPRFMRAKASPLVLTAVTVMGTFGFLYPMMTYHLGQPTPLAVFATVWVVAMFHQDRPILASLGMSALVFRPEGAIVAGGLALLALYQRRYKFLALTAILMTLIYGGIALILGFDWAFIWVDVARAYSQYTFPVWVPSLVGSPLNIILILAIFAWSVWTARRIWKFKDTLRDWWLVAILIVLVLVLVPQTRSYTLIWGLIPVSVGLWTVKRRDRTIWGLFTLAVLSPWINYFIWVVNNDYGRFGDLVTPALIVVFLVWVLRKTIEPR